MIFQNIEEKNGDEYNDKEYDKYEIEKIPYICIICSSEDAL